ncbi:MAG: Arm DNA-binding domain-containing protein, partial [Neobacillus sp.]
MSNEIQQNAVTLDNLCSNFYSNSKPVKKVTALLLKIEALCMAKQILTDTTLRNTKPGAKDKRLNDGSGLYLLIKTNGAKWWRFDYSFEGKRKTLSLGVYPATGLADARRKAEEARTNVANGTDPSNTRKATKAAQQLATENEKR